MTNGWVDIIIVIESFRESERPIFRHQHLLMLTRSSQPLDNPCAHHFYIVLQGIESTSICSWAMSNTDPTSQIRMLVLVPAVKATPVSFDFEPAEIRAENVVQEAPWEAISYRWDSSGLLHDIRVKDGTLQIRDNIFRMLNDLWLQDQERRLWIYAICIDQTDKRE